MRQDGITGVGSRLWLGVDAESKALALAAGNVTPTPNVEIDSFAALGQGATRRVPITRTCDMAFQSLFWRQTNKDLLRFLATNEDIAVLLEYSNGAAALVKGPHSSFSVTAPTNALVQIEGTVENGEYPYIALVGHRIAGSGDPVGDGSPGYANWDWSGKPLYAVAVVDLLDHAAGNDAPVLSGVLQNTLEADGSGHPGDFPFEFYRGVDQAGDQVGAGLQVHALPAVPALKQDQGRYGTVQITQNAGWSADQPASVYRTYLMQEMGVATK